MSAVARTVRGARVVAGASLQESLRRRVFLVVLVLTLAFGALYAWGVHELFQDIDQVQGNGLLDGKALAGATILGLAMFGTLFLGVVLCVFFTLNAVRGDAERGLLQPMIVRPLGRPAYLLGRWAAATGVAGAYVIVVFLGAVVITGLVGGWWPDHVVAPALELAAAVAVVAGIAVLGSIVLGTTANGIAVLMVFGAGLLCGLLGQIGAALDSGTLVDVARWLAWVLPFQGLYGDALFRLVSDTAAQGGLTAQLVQLGPLGGSAARATPFFPYVVAYVAAVGALATWTFARRDL